MGARRSRRAISNAAHTVLRSPRATRDFPPMHPATSLLSVTRTRGTSLGAARTARTTAHTSQLLLVGWPIQPGRASEMSASPDERK